MPVKRDLLGVQRMVAIDVGSAGGRQPHWRTLTGLVDFLCFDAHRASWWGRYASGVQTGFSESLLATPEITAAASEAGHFGDGVLVQELHR
jgi:hypothetical protein